MGKTLGMRRCLSGASVACLLTISSLAGATSAESSEKPLHRLSPGVNPPLAVQPNTQKPQILVYKTKLADGTARFSDQRPQDQTFELLRFDCFACTLSSGINWHNTPLYPQRFSRFINSIAHELQLDSALIRAVIHAESAFNPQAVSVKGASGLMQLMPATMQQFNVTDAHEPEQNIRAGSRYLAKLIQEFNGDLSLALAAYNAGPGAVKRYNGIPPFPETQAYIERVHILMKRYQH